MKAIKSEFSEGISFYQASNVQEAIESLQKREFHLLITDLKMPLKHDTPPNNSGGESLIKSLYRKKSELNVPMYIVALTQFSELQLTFKGLWKVLHYDGAIEDWKTVLRDLVFHISYVKSRIIAKKLPTVFLEGPIDKKICIATLHEFNPDVLEKIHFDTINFGGGASWVERKLFIWAKSLEICADSKKYLKAVGVFDDDAAGNQSISRLKAQIDHNSAENETFSIVKNAYKHSPLLKSINQKGIKFQTTLEELIGIKCWEFAEKKNWLQKRDLKTLIIDPIIIKNTYEDLNQELLLSIGFSEDESLMILYKVHADYKKEFCNYVCSLPSDERKKSLQNINYLLTEAIDKLKI